MENVHNWNSLTLESYALFLETVFGNEV